MEVNIHGSTVIMAGMTVNVCSAKKLDQIADTVTANDNEDTCNKERKGKKRNVQKKIL
jgi:hypothetical protein